MRRRQIERGLFLRGEKEREYDNNKVEKGETNEERREEKQTQQKQRALELPT